MSDPTKLKVFKGRSCGKGVWFIHCPVCRFDFERPLKRKAIEFAKPHALSHDPPLEVVVVK